jgi:Protein of unknown function (DUF1569)
MKSLASAEVLRETRARLKSVRAEDRALWGKMTATQMVWHVGCAYEVAVGDRVVRPVKGPPPGLMKFVALRSGFRWPKNLATTPELLRALEEELTGEFVELRDRAIAKMDVLASGVRVAASHPFFGGMTAKDWMRWGYLHADHHLRQFGR